MIQQDQSSRRPGLWTALAASAAVGATVITIALPPMEAAADVGDKSVFAYLEGQRQPSNA